MTFGGKSNAHKFWTGPLWYLTSDLKTASVTTTEQLLTKPLTPFCFPGIFRIGTFRWHKLMYLQRVHYGSELRFSGFSLILKVSGKERRRSLCYWFLFCLPSHHSWCQSPWGFDTLPLFTGIKFDNYFYYTTLLIFGWKGSPFQEGRPRGQWLSGGRGASSKNGSLEVTKKQKWQWQKWPYKGFPFSNRFKCSYSHTRGIP